MNTHADKTQENKSQAVAKNLPKLQSNDESAFQFLDNRTEAIVQRKLQEAINNSPRVKQLKAYQEMADGSSQVEQTAQLQTISDNRYAQQQPIQKKENNTGLPDNLKLGIENLSGYTMDDVKVLYNSDKPAQLNAHAYAQGTNIHLAPGQEKHLPHEVWHVVQQKQGRVKPTMQMKGGVNINSDSQLEKEADLMGMKANQNLVTSKESGLKQMKIESYQVIQAKVGYEFETGWLVQHLNDSGEKEWLHKKDKIGTNDRDGYTIEADEAGGEKTELEFIVYPPVEEDEVGVKRLENIMNRMVILGSAMKHMYPKEFNLGVLTGGLEDSKFIITPIDQELKAGAQVTSGVNLSMIESLASIDESLQNENYRKLKYGDEDVSDAPEELKRSLASLSNHAAEAKKAVGVEISPALNGLLAIIRSYLIAGSYKNALHGTDPNDLNKEILAGLAFNYPKRIADLLLARTHFGKLFSLIPPKEQKYYSKNVNEWIQLALTASGGLDPDANVIERGIIVDEEDPSKGFNPVNLTRKKWLSGIVQGVDLLKEIPDAESMGEMEKTEEVGTKTKGKLFDTSIQAGIFEFRGAQSLKIPLERWKPFALAFLKYISAVHS